MSVYKTFLGLCGSVTDGSLKVELKKEGKGDVKVSVEVDKPKDQDWWYGIGFAETKKMVNLYCSATTKLVIQIMFCRKVLMPTSSLLKRTPRSTMSITQGE